MRTLGLLVLLFGCTGSDHDGDPPYDLGGDPDDDVGDDPDPARDCTARDGLPRGKHSCLALTPSEGLIRIDLVTGELTSADPAVALPGFAMINGFAQVADGFVYCAEESRLLTRYDPATGEATVSARPCVSVAPHEGGMLVLGDILGSVDHYESFAAALAGSGTHYPPSPYASRIAVRGDRLYAAWHSTDTIEVYDL